ncbi:NAD kinase [Methylophaga frappieri]|uniref:NAD kinase n=1 Tax=Methylophaga frappieri (strain ATCC BAA-2434 / DSM 25690 / JAM7) TaxID=754477 RepID=I1YGY1_METFJ|nr:NAD(+) kinase [Methylophaga frappieri]AFJ02174.1 NAD kinase [Methylophaga frappieri]
MSNAFRNIGLFIRNNDPTLVSALTTVIEVLTARKLKFCCNQPLNFLPDVAVHPIDSFVDHCDLTIAVGGDGTMLSAGRALAGSDLPVVGINVGRLGFLADVTLKDLAVQLNNILDGEYRHDQRFMLTASYHKTPLGVAMNDIVVHCHQSMRMIEFETHINGRFLNSQRADGVVIATPTGSTAYAMSAGGPILDVDLNAIVITSVCPHTLSNRPLVIAADSVIDITLSENNTESAMVTCDGQTGQLLNPGESIRISRHDKHVDLLHPVDHDHYSILRAKLEWGRKLTC